MASILLDLPMQFLRPSGAKVKEFAFKTIPSVTKPEIKTVLESTFGLEVEKVRTLNMKGKKKRQGMRYISRPNYKKVYVTLKKPLDGDLLSTGILTQAQAQARAQSSDK